MRKRSYLPTIFILLFILLLGAAGYTFFKDMDGPQVSVSPKTGRISPQGQLNISMSDPSGIRSINVGIRKNNTLNTIFNKHFSEFSPTRQVEIPLKNLNLREGTFDLEVRVTDASLAGFGQGNTRTIQVPIRFDSHPPKISIKTMPPNIRRGGSGLIRYTIDEEIDSTGVEIAGYAIPGYQQKDGSYLCLFPFPYSMNANQFKNSIEIWATDIAGNTTKNRLAVFALERAFKSDKIDLSDNFLATVQNKLGELAPNTSNPLECYLHINKEIRKENALKLREISKTTLKDFLWEGSFARLPKAAPRAGFADHRTFSYQGKQVGESFHLGFDLASVKNAEVPATNHGKVVFVGQLGIYGNIIMIDHGMGLMSLYSHLSDMTVSTSDNVTKGQIIGHTGSTGLAFGDHLHFGIVVAGVEVTPQEWLDRKWINDNILTRMQ